MQKVVSINSELTRICYQEYLDTLSTSELAYWLINSFTPMRYYDKHDVVEHACKRIKELVNHKNGLGEEFVSRLWGMHGMLPPENA